MPGSLRVLIVEDSEDDTLLLTRELRRGNFDPVYERVDCPEAMSSALDSQTWDLVLADFSMPYFRGDVALAMLRERGLDIPFIFVSGTIGEEAAVAAMRVGANDYIIKGNLKRLIPAIERELNEAEARRKRRQTEQALIESNARYRELVENATYGIYCSAMEARFLEVNPALVDILGYASKEQLLSLDVAEEVYCLAQDCQRVVREARESRRFQGLEVQWKRRDGRSIVVRLSGRVLGNAADKSQWLEVIAEDITERRALQRQITALQKFDAIGRLAGGIAHDFNNVIGAILGWADLGAQEASTDSRFTRYFEVIRDNSRLAADLTRQLLAFARKQPLDPVAVDLNQIVSQAVALLERTIGSSIQITAHLEAGLGTVLADPTQAQQVVMNLCLNARDAMPAGGELVLETTRTWVSEEYARTCPDSKPGLYVLLTVSDSGLGMDAGTLEKIFEPFFTTKEAGKGTGLGLATVYGIVKQHGGFIHVYSEHGSGTTFRVYWPVAGARAKQLPIAHQSASVRGTETILFAEDHEGIRKFTQETLETLGYTALVAKDGEEAVDLFERHSSQVELVILDVTMPKLSGPEAYKQVSVLRPDVPVIFVTGYGREMALLRDLVAQGLTVLQKPFTHQELGQKIRLLLDARSPAKKNAEGQSQWRKGTGADPAW